ncbi:HAD-IA family hydrolase [Candidatus Woesearchaeota archaeon]|nr:HAD-IA family hydrolase [Candidatus Woesearchaeota archaeon]
MLLMQRWLMTRKRKNKLVIFDMDETLVDFYPIHDKAFHKATRKVYDCPGCYEKVDHAGRLIPESIKNMCKICKVPASVIKKNMQKAMKLYIKEFVNSVPKNTGKYVNPGVKKLLNALKGKVKLALVTRDEPEITEKILKATGLDKYFKTAISKDSGKTRADCIRKAIKKMKHKGDVIVFGDSVHDIEAGKKVGATTIAMLTGPTKRARLKKQKPDYIFKDFKNTEKILEAVL